MQQKTLMTITRLVKAGLEAFIGAKQIAVKRLKALSAKADMEYAVEVEILGRVRHNNLLGLRGFFAGGEERLIVYDYMGIAMDSLSILIIHNGKWSLKDGKKVCQGGEGLVMKIKKGWLYNELKEKLFLKLKMDKFKYELEVRYFYKNDLTLPSVLIGDDEELEEFFDLHVEDNERKAVLYVTKNVIRSVGTSNSICHEQVFNTGGRNVNFLSDTNMQEGSQNPNGGCDNVLDSIRDDVDHNLVPPQMGDEGDIDMIREYELPDIPVNENVDRDMSSMGGLHAIHNERTQVETERVIVRNHENYGLSQSEGRTVIRNNNELGIGPSSTPTEIISNGDVSSSVAHVELDLKVDQVFDNKIDFTTHVGLYAIRNRFETRTLTSRKDRVLIRCIQSTCSWMIRCNRITGSDRFRVKEYESRHTCDPNNYMRKNRTATSRVIGNAIKMKLVRPGRIYKPKDIIDDCQNEFGIEIGYTTAYRSKEKALYLLRGSEEESFLKLPSYCHVLKERNPGSVTHIEVDQSGRFKYFFLALGPCIRGFLSCIRHVITVDGAFLSGRYAGTLFVANASDGNNNIYPLAIGVGDSENNEAWEWFLLKLSGIFGHIDDLVIVSDRHQSIIQSVPKAFPNALHGYCAFHMEMNLNHKFKNPDITPLFRCCARAYTKREFDKYMGDLRLIDPDIEKYLLEAGKDKWSRFHFPGNRYGIMTTNGSESFNNVMKSARELPITMLAEYYRSKIQHWFVERREVGMRWGTRLLTDEVDSIMRANHNKSLRYRVFRINAHVFQVVHGDTSQDVDLLNRSCSCREFDVHKIPCCHAIAAARFQDVDVQSLVDRLYTVNCYIIAYAEAIFPATDNGQWDIPEEIMDLVELPPNTKRKSGRPRKRRIRSHGEVIKKLMLCSRCGISGHNRRTCNVFRQMIVEPSLPSQE